MEDGSIIDSPEAVAVIGLAGQFPKAKNVDEFWERLRDGVELVSFYTDEELLAAGISAELLKNPLYVKAGAMMDDVPMFDAAFFGYSPREAEILDPQQRHFLECSWEALENAGYDSDRFDGLIGVFAGVSINNYFLQNLIARPDLIQTMGTFQIGISNDKDFMATRVAYKLNLKGPSMNVQTACSTSLVAIHVACQHLLNGECDMALAGGASISLHSKNGYLYREGGIQSSDGHCRAFDAKAKGIVGGDALGVIVLKRLSDAIEDADHVHAVIKGSACNNDGSLKIGFTAPSIEGQARTIAEAHAMAGVTADTITYVEAHGTGTNLGDPIEVAALTKSFRQTTDRKNFCAIGSVKSNLGHTDAAAGVVSTIKTVLALENKMIPPSLHFEEPNPQIDFADSPFFVNAKLREWSAGATLRRAGVSSFGIGGTNAHLVLEEAPATAPSSDSRPWQLLNLSARTPTALEAASSRLAAHLKQKSDINLADAAYTLQVGRKVFPHRRSIICRDAAEAVEALEGRAHKQVWTDVHGDTNASVVFMFSGQGTQYAGMGAELYETEPAFREQVDYCAEVLTSHLGRDVRDVLFSHGVETEEANLALQQTSLTQPALFVVEYALAQLLIEWGVRPSVMIGHSLGEYVAACLAGVFTLDDALALIAERGRLMQQMPAGAMLGVRLTEREAQSLATDGISVAAVNGPSQCVLSGPIEAVEALSARLTAQSVDSRLLHTSHAFHSAMMDPILGPFAERVKAVKLNAPQIPFVSNVTGTWITAEEATNPGYWARHMRQTVRFAKGVEELVRDTDRVLLEVGPGQTLTTLARQQLDVANRQRALSTLPSAHEQKSGVESLLGTLGRLWICGVQPDWTGFYKNERRSRIPLPTYPFERERYWVEPLAAAVKSEKRLPEGKLPNIADWLYAALWKQTLRPVLTASETEAARQSRWLIFTNGCALGSRLVDEMKRRSFDCIVATEGDAFEQLAAGTYTFNPSNRDDFEALFKELRAVDRMPTRVVHLLSVTNRQANEVSAESFLNAQQRGLYSLIKTAKALREHSIEDSLRIDVISSDAQDVTAGRFLCAEKATTQAFCKIIPQEFTGFRCRSIDVAGNDAADVAGPEKLAAQLLDELAKDPIEKVVAYRDNRRWVQVYEPAPLPEATTETSLLKEEGVYLITGGLGKIGLRFAAELVRNWRAKLVLTSRSVFLARDEWQSWLDAHAWDDDLSVRIRSFKEVEELGAEILLVKADVTSDEQMRAAIEQTHERFGRLDGVIHAAGDDGVWARKSFEEVNEADFVRQFEAKVHGLINLAHVLRGQQLDFCFVMSSLSVVLGGLGFLTSAAAHFFVDAFVARLNQHASSFPWFCVDWDGWEQGTEEELAAGVAQGNVIKGVLPAEGVEIFRRVLTRNSFSPVVVSTENLHTRIAKWIDLESVRREERTEEKKSFSAHARPSLSNPYVAPQNEIQETVATIWETLLGFEQVGIYDNLFDLGGDSLLIVQIISRVRETLRVEVPLRSVFEEPTIAALADKVEQLRRESSADVRTIAETLELVERLSGEELDTLLSQQES
jgi:acyl transferase domain-containing protein/acyl carrier protein